MTRVNSARRRGLSLRTFILQCAVSHVIVPQLHVLGDRDVLKGHGGLGVMTVLLFEHLRRVAVPLDLST